MRSSSSVAAIWPWAMVNFASGAFCRSQAAASSRSSRRGQTKKLCPPRKRSRKRASRTMRSSKGVTKVRTARRSTGGVAMIDSSRTPVSASCKVRGIGVADRVSTWTSARNSLSRSLWPTPKCCSSSMTTRPRFLKLTFLPSTAWVPMTISTEPSAAPCARVAHVGGAGHARHLRQPHRQSGETRGEILVMLAREQSGRHDHRDLHAVDRGGESRAQGHFGLAEADVAADQPVHRLARGHVGQRRLDGAELVLGLVIGEAGAEFLVKPLGRRQFRRLVQRAGGGDLDQPLRHLADAQFQARLALAPGGMAEPVERDLGVFRAVARQQLDILDRHEQLVAGDDNAAPGNHAARPPPRYA